MAPLTAAGLRRRTLASSGDSTPPAAASAASAASGSAAASPAPKSWFQRTLGPDSVYAPADFPSSQRWRMMVPAFATHVCIGTPWAWSVMAAPLTLELGGVVPAAADWAMAEVSAPMSILFGMMGVSAAVLGKWQLKVGVRSALATASVLFGGGMMLGGAGIALHSLPLIYGGFGFFSGLGIGMAYTPPVATLIEWMPGQRGLASGLCIAGFGSGGLIFTALTSELLDHFYVPPTYLGPLDAVSVTTKGGSMYADVAGSLTEVVHATAAELAKLSAHAGSSELLKEGLYVVGSGNTGAAATLTVLGATAFATMAASALALRRPAPGWRPAGFVAPSPSSGVKVVEDIPTNVAIKTPQFLLLGTSFFCLATGGMAMFSVAKSMMSEVFAGTQPSLAAFSSVYVSLLSMANLTGRLGWSAFSDYAGRRRTFQIFTIGSIPLYLSLPWLVNQAVASHSLAPGVAFVGVTALAVTMMGGAYAALPAYESDLFGSKFVGSTHGYMLIGSSAAAITGPSLILQLRSSASNSAIAELLPKVDPQRFEQLFSAPISAAPQLIESKALTLSKLVTLLPPGVPDPSPFLYDQTMFTMAGLMTVAAVTHHFVRPPTITKPIETPKA